MGVGRTRLAYAKSWPWGCWFGRGFYDGEQPEYVCVCVCVCVCHDVTDWEQPTVFKRSDLACCSQFLKLALESDERYCSGDSLKYSMRDRRKNITICYLTD